MPLTLKKRIVVQCGQKDSCHEQKKRLGSVFTDRRTRVNHFIFRNLTKEISPPYVISLFVMSWRCKLQCKMGQLFPKYARCYVDRTES